MQEYKILNVYPAPAGLEAWYKWDEKWPEPEDTTDIRVRADGKRFVVERLHFVALVEEGGVGRTLLGLDLCDGTFEVCDQASNFAGLFFPGDVKLAETGVSDDSKNVP